MLYEGKVKDYQSRVTPRSSRSLAATSVPFPQVPSVSVQVYRSRIYQCECLITMFVPYINVCSFSASPLDICLYMLTFYYMKSLQIEHP
jgi:hypothetical protein